MYKPCEHVANLCEYIAKNLTDNVISGCFLQIFRKLLCLNGNYFIQNINMMLLWGGVMLCTDSFSFRRTANLSDYLFVFMGCLIWFTHITLSLSVKYVESAIQISGKPMALLTYYSRYIITFKHQQFYRTDWHIFCFCVAFWFFFLILPEKTIITFCRKSFLLGLYILWYRLLISFPVIRADCSFWVIHDFRLFRCPW